jgi:hypothetical protein
MPLKVSHVLNTLRSGRPTIFSKAIKCVLKIVLQNFTTRGFSYAAIAKKVKKRGHKIVPRTV